MAAIHLGSEFQYLLASQEVKAGFATQHLHMIKSGVESAFCVYHDPEQFSVSQVANGSAFARNEVGHGLLRLIGPPENPRHDVAFMTHTHRCEPGDNVVNSATPSAVDLKDFPRFNEANPGVIEGVLSAGLGKVALCVYRLRTGMRLNQRPLNALRDNASWVARREAMRLAGIQTVTLAVDGRSGQVLSHSYIIDKLFE